MKLWHQPFTPGDQSWNEPLNAPALLARLRMRQIVLLLAIEERGRAAAAALNMTQSAASKMLHELEQATASRCSSG